MRLTIVKDDDLVIIDQRPITVDLSQYSLPENFHALQWYEDVGEEEYSDDSLNVRITDITRYQPIINEYRRLAEIEDNPPPPSEADNYAGLIGQRNYSLRGSDWVVQRHADELALHIKTTLTAEEYAEIQRWRQTLRELAQKYPTSDVWEWPDTPEALAQAEKQL